MKLYAISDLHVGVKCNEQALGALPFYPNDWLIIAGDIGETVQHLHYTLNILTRHFAQVIWVPGNHDLWTIPSPSEAHLIGEERYYYLVKVCRSYGVITPEDPYPVWPGGGKPTLIVPLFLLYDYSFRDNKLSVEQAMIRAEEANVVCTDEFLLNPAPYTSRGAWCQARCNEAERRLKEIPPAYSIILINHFPIRREHVRVNNIPQFSIWCGTSRTQDWITRFPISVVVYGHVHVRATDYINGTRFEEVSLGYKNNWDQEKGMQSYLRQILPDPPIETPIHTTVWHK